MRFNTGHPQHPGLYEVDWMSDGSSGIYCLWSGRTWYDPDYRTGEAEAYALHRSVSPKQTIPWRHITNGTVR